MTAGPDPGGSREIGRYRLIADLAKGPLGPLAVGVISGTQPAELVTIRTLVRATALAPTDVDELAEAAWWSLELCHPNILRSKDVVVTAQQLAIVSDHEEGEILRTLVGQASVKGHPAPAGIALRIVLDALEALTYLEEEAAKLAEGSGDLAHGGLLPDSVLVGVDGRARILDAGIGPVAQRITSMAEQPELAAYMAPEFIAGGAVDGRAAVFSVGVQLWELLTGKRLFAGATYDTVVERVASGSVQSLDNLRPAGGAPVPQPAADIVAKALQRDPAERFDSSHAMAQAVRSVPGDLMATHEEVSEYALSLAAKTLRGRRVTVSRLTGTKFAPLPGLAGGPGRADPGRKPAVDRQAPPGAVAPLPPKPKAPAPSRGGYDEPTIRRSFDDLGKARHPVRAPKPALPVASGATGYDEATLKKPLTDLKAAPQFRASVPHDDDHSEPPPISVPPDSGDEDTVYRPAKQSAAKLGPHEDDDSEPPPISVAPDSGDEDTVYRPARREAVKPKVESGAGRSSSTGSGDDEVTLFRERPSAADDSEPPPITVPPDSGEEANRLVLSSTELLGEPAPWQQASPGASADSPAGKAKSSELGPAEAPTKKPPGPKKKVKPGDHQGSRELATATTAARARPRAARRKTRWLPIAAISLLGALALGGLVVLVSWLFPEFLPFTSPASGPSAAAQPEPEASPAAIAPATTPSEEPAEAPVVEEPSAAEAPDAAAADAAPTAAVPPEPPPRPVAPSPGTWRPKPPDKPANKFVPSGI